MDRHTPEQRHKNMQAVKSKDTSIEVKVRQYLFAQGFCFRKNDRRYPCNPAPKNPKWLNEKAPDEV